MRRARSGRFAQFPYRRVGLGGYRCEPLLDVDRDQPSGPARTGLRSSSATSTWSQRGVRNACAPSTVGCRASLPRATRSGLTTGLTRMATPIDGLRVRPRRTVSHRGPERHPHSTPVRRVRWVRSTAARRDCGHRQRRCGGVGSGCRSGPRWLSVRQRQTHPPVEVNMTAIQARAVFRERRVRSVASFVFRRPVSIHRWSTAEPSPSASASGTPHA
jgi:hypothetical protein